MGRVHGRRMVRPGILDSSVAPLLDMRRRFEAVVDVLGAMIRYGVSLSQLLELTAQ